MNLIPRKRTRNLKGLFGRIRTYEWWEWLGRNYRITCNGKPVEALSPNINNEWWWV